MLYGYFSIFGKGKGSYLSTPPTNSVLIRSEEKKNKTVSLQPC